MNKQVDSMVKALKSKGIWTTNIIYPNAERGATIQSQNVSLIFKDTFTVIWAEPGEIGIRVFSEHTTKTSAMKAFIMCIHLNKMRSGR